MKIHYEFKRVLGVILAFSAILLLDGNNRVYAYSQSLENVTTGSAVTCGLQFLGTGLSTPLNTIDIQVENTSGGNVPIGSTSFKIVEYDDANYTCTYPCTTNKRNPDTYTVYPSNRYSGGNITSGTGHVTIRSTWTNTNLNPNKYYTIGYTASNLGNNLKIVGTNENNYSGGTFRYSLGDGGNYCRVDNPQVYSTTGMLADMYFSINDAVEPTAMLTGSQPADLADQTIKLDLSGTMQVGSSQRLDILGWSYCTKSGYASYHSQTPDNHTQFLSTGTDSCLTSTRDDGSGYYHGAGWCYSPYNANWTATGIKFPYPNDGYTCEYPITYNLYEWSNGRWNLLTSGDITTITTVPPTASGGLECDGLDTGAYIACKIKSVFLEIFGFNNIDFSTASLLKDQLSAHAPFAYALSVFDLDVSSAVVSTSTPTLSIAFANGSPTYNWIGSAGVDSFFTSIRTVVSIFLWILLTVYIVTRMRSLAEHL